jgi:hypothetical protein
VSPRKVDYPKALTAWCPYCDVLPGVLCRSDMGRDRLYPHATRVRRANRIGRGSLSPSRPGEPTGRTATEEQLPLVGYEPEPSDA